MRYNIEYTNSQMSALIDEHIHNSKYRDVLKLRLLDGMTYERIAETVDMSTQQIKTIVYRAEKTLIKHIK